MNLRHKNPLGTGANIGVSTGAKTDRLNPSHARWVSPDGYGYSSLAYLKRFQLDSLKIDKSFVDNLGADLGDSAVVRSIFGLSRSLNLEVVAEGVETALQLDTLHDLADGSEYLIQGFYYAAPMAVADFELWLAHYRAGKPANALLN